MAFTVCIVGQTPAHTQFFEAAADISNDGSNSIARMSIGRPRQLIIQNWSYLCVPGETMLLYVCLIFSWRIVFIIQITRLLEIDTIAVVELSNEHGESFPYSLNNKPGQFQRA